METETRRLTRMIVSALSKGIIAAGGVMLGAVSTDGNVKPGTWLIAGVTGVVALFGDIQSNLSSPPHAPSVPDPRPLVDPSGQQVR